MKREEKIRFEEVDNQGRTQGKKQPKRQSADRQKNARGSKKSQNKEFARVTYFFVILFLALMTYIVYFNVVRAKTIVNSPYNKRQDAFADRVVRGDITDRNGNILAETIVYDDGTEERSYPYDDIFAHVVGYSFPSTGKSGVEAAQNFDLLTSNAFFPEKLMNEFKDQKNMGDTVVTTLDADLQESAYHALGESRGAVVVMEAQTGKILSMVSSPSFDPNQAESEWDYLNSDDAGSPLLNRATQGLYAPGSTFKIITALEFMRENPDYYNYEYDCIGEITHGETTINCFNHTAHGYQDLRSAVANSCNSAFADIGLSLNRTSYCETAESLMFNKKLPSVLDYSKSRFEVNESTPDSELMMTAMGQGQTMVSPYHMALIVSAVANDGVLMNPYLVEKVTNHGGSEMRKNVPKSYRKLMTPEEAAQLQEYMSAVVTEGTGSMLNGESYSVAGKTGTAEYSIDDGSKTHSWFVGYTGGDDPDLVISVVIEGNDENAETKAVPIVKQILDQYYYR